MKTLLRLVVLFASPFILIACPKYLSYGWIEVECNAPHNISYCTNFNVADRKIPALDNRLESIDITINRIGYLLMNYKSWDNLVLEFPDDTFSVYIFHPDTVAKYPLEYIQQEYKVLVRYDIGADDYYKVPGTNRNKYKKWITIPYPPIPSMASVHMYPPYEEVMAQYEEDCRKIAEREGE